LASRFRRKVSTAKAGDAVVARQLYERALRILEYSLGTGHTDVALVKHNFAVLLAGQGDPDTAFDLAGPSGCCVGGDAAAGPPAAARSACDGQKTVVTHPRSD
jgi:Tetratricopeptide repeat